MPASSRQSVAGAGPVAVAPLFRASATEKLLDWLIFHDPPNPKLWVQNRPLHWTLNFAHPRALAVLARIPLLLAGLVIILAAGSLSPGNSVFAVGSLAAAVMLFGGVACGFTRAELQLQGFGLGLLAVAVGFGLQTILNGGVVLLFGQAHLTWMHHLYLGPVAGLCQTAGKYLAILAVCRLLPPVSPRAVLGTGLTVGFSFAFIEISVIAASALFGTDPDLTHALLGVWERGSASLFHICTGGLVAAALVRRQTRWLVFAVIAHGVLDWLAGSAAGLGLLQSLLTLEVVFSGVSAVVLLAWLAARLGVSR